jgi:hypothetical protein
MKLPSLSLNQAATWPLMLATPSIVFSPGSVLLEDDAALSQVGDARR